MRIPLIGLAALVALGGCFGTRIEPTGGLPGERRAALATVLVENRTTEALAISFLYAAETGGSGGEIGVGTAPPGARTRMAPVPAAEPIVLIARGGRAEHRLPPRTLEVDEVWTWVVEERPYDGGAP